MLEFMHMFNVYALHTDIALVYFYLNKSTGKLFNQIGMLMHNAKLVRFWYGFRKLES